MRQRYAASVFQQRYFALQGEYVACEAREVGEVAFRQFDDGRRYAQVEAACRQVAVSRADEYLSCSSALPHRGLVLFLGCYFHVFRSIFCLFIVVVSTLQIYEFNSENPLFSCG